MSTRSARNPGPPGGYRIIRAFHRYLPQAAFRLALGAGAGVTMMLMPRARAHSREYLRLVLGREPTRRDVWRHFNSFAESLVARLVQASGYRLMEPTGHGGEFLALLRSGTQALYGTFHVGCADIIGFLLGESPSPIHMVRLRVGNAHDIERLMQNYGSVRVIWVNEPGEMISGIKTALDAGGTLALQCDRPEFAGKREAFRFFGVDRPFPMTIYHLAALYKLPVAFCFSFLERDGCIASHACRIFRPEPGARKADVIEAGRAHFREVLAEVELLLRRYPYQWFNFGPMVPEPGTSL